MNRLRGVMSINNRMNEIDQVVVAIERIIERSESLESNRHLNKAIDELYQARFVYQKMIEAKEA